MTRGGAILDPLVIPPNVRIVCVSLLPMVRSSRPGYDDSGHPIHGLNTLTFINADVCAGTIAIVEYCGVHNAMD